MPLLPRRIGLAAESASEHGEAGYAETIWHRRRARVAIVVPTPGRAERHCPVLHPLVPAGAEDRLRLLIVFNPAAGGGRRRPERLRRVVAALEQLGCSVVVRQTQRRGDAEFLARTAEPEFDRIVAAGGDGTINEVVNGLGGAPRPLALVPLGTANILAGEIGLPRNVRRLAAVIVGGEPRPIWPARAGGRLFVACLGAGFDADVVAAVDERLKARIGKLAFAWAIMLQLWRYRARDFVLREEGGAVHSAASVVIAKTRYYAGRFVLADAARAADPRFQVVLFRRGSRIAAARYVAAMTLGLIGRLSDVAILPARSVALEAAEPERIEADGELAGWLPLTVEIAAAPVLLVHPAPP
jgi:diacylglycerol kinase (ATP)